MPWHRAAEPVAVLVQHIKDSDPGTETDYAALCASHALAHKGESIIPDMIALLETRQVNQEMYALEALSSLRGSGAKAVPYLVERLRTGAPDTFAEWTYHTLAWIGEGARPAIPFLIGKSWSTVDDSFSESKVALQTLAALAPYEPDPIMANLVRLLDDPKHVFVAAETLENLGALAKPAAEPVRKHLLSAVSAGQDDVAAALIVTLDKLDENGPSVAPLVELLDRRSAALSAAQALEKIGPDAKAAVPALLAHLRVSHLSPEEHKRLMAALTAIDERSPVILRLNIRSTTKRKNWSDEYETASRLARVDPAITVRDLAARLGLALQDYVEEVDAGGVRLTAKRDWARSPAGASPVFSVSVPVVRQRLFTGSSDPDLYEQSVEIRLAEGACASLYSIDAEVRSPGPARSPMQTIEVVAHHLQSSQVASVEITHDHSASAGDAHRSRLWAGPGCGVSVGISKSFAPGYWSSVCPFHPDDRFVHRVVIPAVRKLLGAELEAYDTNSLRWQDSGQLSVQFAYDERHPSGAGPDWQPGRVWLAIDRCSNSVSLISKRSP